MQKTGFVVVTRLNYYEASPFIRKTKRMPLGGFSHEEIKQKYGGFSGILWQDKDFEEEYGFADGIIPLENYSDALDIFRKIENDCPSTDLIIIDSSIPSQIQLDNFEFIGIDFGIYDCETKYFSAILNEILYGCLPEMGDFTEYLNDRLLFDSFDVVEDLIKVRTLLTLVGADLETYAEDEVIQPFSIWEYQKSNDILCGLDVPRRLPRSGMEE